MDDKQSIGSRIGDFAYLAAVCFLAYIKILTNWQVMSLMGGFMAARYAVKAIKENKTAAKEMIAIAIGAASSSGQFAANPNSIRPGAPPPDEKYPPEDPHNKITTQLPQQRNLRQSTPGEMRNPGDDARREPPYEGRGRIKRLALELIPILVGLILCLVVIGCDMAGVLQ